MESFSVSSDLDNIHDHILRYATILSVVGIMLRFSSVVSKEC